MTRFGGFSTASLSGLSGLGSTSVEPDRRAVAGLVHNDRVARLTGGGNGRPAHGAQQPFRAGSREAFFAAGLAAEAQAAGPKAVEAMGLYMR